MSEQTPELKRMTLDLCNWLENVELIAALSEEAFIQIHDKMSQAYEAGRKEGRKDIVWE